MGKKICDILKRKDVGAIGIGAMIIFIAMVLVAGIAASVLVQTSTKLETQALKTGSETIGQVASGILIEGIEGYNSSGAIVRMAVEIRPRAGSPDVDLRTTIIEISDGTTKYVLTYDSGTFTEADSIGGDMFTAGFYPSGSATTKFGVIVLQDVDESCSSGTPVLNFGDHVALTVDNVFTGITPRTNIFGMVIPEEGSGGIIGFRTPESYTNAVMDLQ